MNADNKIKVLSMLSDQLTDERFSKGFIEAYMKDTGYLKKDIVEREIQLPVSILKQIAGNIDNNDLRPLGKIAILLPHIGINAVMAKAICSSFLIGNHTIMKLPRKLKNVSPWFRKLVTNHLPETEFAPDEQSAETFINDSISSTDIKAVVIYGSDKWIWGYKNNVRKTNTKLIFEGPGKNPQIILPDANIDTAVTDAIKWGLLNGGQSCAAAERFFVHHEVLDEFKQQLRERISLLKIGDPEDDEIDIGPINSDAVINRMIGQLIDARQRGGRIITGGSLVEIGCSCQLSFLPTIITECTTDMSVVRNENFGPLFPIISFHSETELLSLVDQSNYGLNASIYGTSSSLLTDYLNRNHRSIYFNSTVINPENSESWILDGGFRNSGFIWEWRGSDFIQREGRRLLLEELSQSN